MNCQVLPPSSERQTPLLLGSGGGACPPRPPPPPPPPPRWPGCTRVPSSLTPAPVPPLAPTSICAKTTFGLVRQISSPMRPMIGLFGNPVPASFVHVLPASTVFQIALPGPPPLNPQATRRRWYDAANSVFGLE